MNSAVRGSQVRRSPALFLPKPLFSIVAAPIYIATDGGGGFPKNVGLLKKRIDSLPLLNSEPSQKLGGNFNGHFYGTQSRGLAC